jgi:hypothetical protein
MPKKSSRSWSEILLHSTMPEKSCPWTRDCILNFKEPRYQFQGIDSQAYVAWRAGTTTLFLPGSWEKN